MVAKKRIKCAKCDYFPNISHKLKNAETTPQKVCDKFSSDCYEELKHEKKVL